MTFIDFFAGIGGLRLGFELAGHKCIGYCEKDKYAVKSYHAMYNMEDEWYAEDITKLESEQIPYSDIWTAGFPCQNISVAGKQEGLRGNRSGLYFELIRLLKGKEEEDKPTWITLENVKNLLSINDGFDFATILSELDEAGYDAMWQVQNSKDHGVPQNRERVFIIANLRSRGRREILPISRENSNALKQVIGGMQGYRVYDTDGVSTTILGGAGGVGSKTGLYFIDQSTIKTEITDVSRCITSRYTGGIVNHTATNSAVLEAYPILTPERAEKRQNGRRVKDSDEPMFTITSSDRHGIIINDRRKDDVRSSDVCPTLLARDYKEPKKVLMENYRIRRLTPRECFRLQGFPDALFDKAQAVNSDSQLYKQAGNAVTVNVAYAVAMSISNI
jgi:DNA (cytosine-5)-methyltransferase 1